MPKRSIYDTRFFVEYFYSSDRNLLEKLKEDIRSTRERMVSAITLHEIYCISLKKEGREVAELRSETIRRDLQTLEVDHETAIRSAELRAKYRIPMADSIIAAAAQIKKCPIVSDDPHFQMIENLKTRWPLKP